MKKIMLILLLVISMLIMVGFAPVETSYWEDVKEMYEWNAIEGESEIEFILVTPDEEYQYKVYINSESSLKDCISYIEIKIEDVKGLQDIPNINMYTNGSNLYVNKDAVLALLATMGSDEAIDIQEEYVMLENNNSKIDIDTNMLNDMIKFVEDMDLGIDLGMVKDGNTYTLTLESDKMIDLDGYYLKFGEYDLEEGTSYITAEDAYALLDFEIQEEILPIRELENYGFYVQWNPENATIEIYK